MIDVQSHVQDLGALLLLRNRLQHYSTARTDLCCSEIDSEFKHFSSLLFYIKICTMGVRGVRLFTIGSTDSNLVGKG